MKRRKESLGICIGLLVPADIVLLDRFVNMPDPVLYALFGLWAVLFGWYAYRYVKKLRAQKQ